MNKTILIISFALFLFSENICFSKFSYGKQLNVVNFEISEKQHNNLEFNKQTNSSSKINNSVSIVNNEKTIFLDYLLKYHLGILITGVLIVFGFILYIIKLKSNLNKITKENKELYISTDTLRKFLNIISHDLKGPASSLHHLLKLINKQWDGLNKADFEKHLKNAYKSSERLDILIHNLITWSNIQDNKINACMENHSIYDIVDEEIKTLKTSFEKKNIEILNYVPATTSVFADKNMLSHIIRNIVQNAIKFSYKNSKIEINSKEANENLILSIQDYGTGIKDCIKDRIFDISNKTSTIGTDRERGTGLGLKLAKEFIEMNNGEIWFDSKEKVGTTFYIKLLINEEVLNGKEN